MHECTKECNEMHTFEDGCALQVPPRPTTDEEIAQLPTLDPAMLDPAALLSAAQVLDVGEHYLTALRDAEVDTDLRPIASSSGGIQPRVVNEPPKTVMDLKAKVSIFDGMGPLAYSEQLAEADEGDFEITWVRLVPTGLRCVVEKDGERRTVDLHEHDLMVLMAETGIAAFELADVPNGDTAVARPTEAVVDGVPVPNGWERVEGGGSDNELRQVHDPNGGTEANPW